MLEGFISKGAKQEHAVSAEDCLNALTDVQKEKLIKNKSELEFEAGETIIKQGFVASNILFVEEGLARLDIMNDGQRSTVSLVAPKSFVGINCTFAYHNVDFSCVALEKTRISVIDMELFEEFIKTNGAFAYLVIRHMSVVTNRHVHKITRLSMKHIDGALALMLLDFARVYKSNSYRLPLNRKEMAAMLGYSKESLINSLSKLNKEGIVKVQEKNIELMDVDHIQRISRLG